MSGYSVHLFLSEEESEVVDELLSRPDELPDGLLPILEHIAFWKEAVE